jgi:hypothetical protein
MGRLTQEKRQELIRVGIDDMYTPVNFRPDIIDCLPWISEERLDDP